MPFKETFSEFYTKVKASLEEGTFAKLTLAKTIGNTELMNIYVRPIVEENSMQLELKFKFQKEEIFEIQSIDNAFNRLLEFVNNHFLSAILFTKEFDFARMDKDYKEIVERIYRNKHWTPEQIREKRHVPVSELD